MGAPEVLPFGRGRPELGGGTGKREGGQVYHDYRSGLPRVLFQECLTKSVLLRMSLQECPCKNVSLRVSYHRGRTMVSG